MTLRFVQSMLTLRQVSKASNGGKHTLYSVRLLIWSYLCKHYYGFFCAI